MVLFSKAAGDVKHFSLLHSIEDKPYIRPSTSEGFSGKRNQITLTLSDIKKAGKLPKYDRPEKLMY